MPKGKKFDAAEKHFKEKELKLNRQMRVYEESTKEANNRAITLQAENDALRKENELLKAMNKELQELHKLSDEDVKALIQRAHSIQTFVGMIDIMDNFR